MNLRRASLLVAGLLLIAVGLATIHLRHREMPLAGVDEAQGPQAGEKQPGQEHASPTAGLRQAQPTLSSPKGERVEVVRSMMSTWVRIVAYGPNPTAVARTVDGAFGRMSALERQLSRYDPESEVSRLNAAPPGTPVVVGEDTWRVLEAAQVAWKRTGGVFDVTVGPLVALWREAGARGTLPTEEELARARAAVGLDKVRLEPEGAAPFDLLAPAAAAHPPPTGGSPSLAGQESRRLRRVTLTQPGMSIDLGGIAKGYIVDQGILFLKGEGVTSALIAGGGDIRALGRRGDGAPWVTAVRNPATESGEPFLTLLGLTDGAVLTSGNYARYVTIGGRRYSHIVDPRTGWPESEVSSATVIGPDAMSTDPLATALTILGPVEGVKLIESLPGYECLIVTGEADDLHLARSPGFRRYEVGRTDPFGGVSDLPR
jgi:thiamine biosynthesis lipoprotein